jgi:hypothetical protein
MVWAARWVKTRPPSRYPSYAVFPSIVAAIHPAKYTFQGKGYLFFEA